MDLFLAVEAGRINPLNCGTGKPLLDHDLGFDPFASQNASSFGRGWQRHQTWLNRQARRERSHRDGFDTLKPRIVTSR